MTEKNDEFVKLLLEWFKKNKRDFSWRNNNITSFQVLVAELMLQKTNANQVEKIFPEFIKKYPDASSISKLGEKALAEILQPLGLFNRRARDLVKTVEFIIEHGNKLPKTEKELKELPGVGDYMANAVACFAFKIATPIIDANVGRVMKRIFSFPVKSAPSRDKNLKKRMEEILPKKKFRDFNLALLDFAALVCVPRTPSCNQCPLLKICDYGQTK